MQQAARRRPEYLRHIEEAAVACCRVDRRAGGAPRGIACSQRLQPTGASYATALRISPIDISWLGTGFLRRRTVAGLCERLQRKRLS